MEKVKSKFSWGAVVSEFAASRPLLGNSTRVEVYRLFQFTLREIMENELGEVKTDDMFRRAGKLAGNIFFQQFCKNAVSVSELIKKIEIHFKELGIGIFRIERIDMNGLSFQLTIDEDLDCSGLPDSNEHICVYDEGFVQGIFEGFTGKTFAVEEIDCWCSGARTCRFKANAIE